MLDNFITREEAFEIQAEKLKAQVEQLKGGLGTVAARAARFETALAKEEATTRAMSLEIERLKRRIAELQSR